MAICAIFLLCGGGGEGGEWGVWGLWGVGVRGGWWGGGGISLKLVLKWQSDNFVFPKSSKRTRNKLMYITSVA